MKPHNGLVSEGSRRLRLLLFVHLIVLIVASASPSVALADSSKYPRFAQQALPPDVRPEFISVDELIAEVKKNGQPVIIDVRTREEFREAHIQGAISAPLAEFDHHLKTIPKDRLAVLY